MGKVFFFFVEDHVENESEDRMGTVKCEDCMGNGPCSLFIPVCHIYVALLPLFKNGLADFLSVIRMGDANLLGIVVPNRVSLHQK